MWNQFVSIILGIVATILSIVSLKMGFDSADNAKTTELHTQAILDEIVAKIQQVEKQQSQLYNVVSQNSQNTQVDNISNGNWAISNIKENE